VKSVRNSASAARKGNTSFIRKKREVGQCPNNLSQTTKKGGREKKKREGRDRFRGGGLVAFEATEGMIMQTILLN